MKNVGVAFNFSYALMAGENPAESIAFLARSNKLFRVHLSDCQGVTDDMMPPGSVHLWELMEALFYLRARGIDEVAARNLLVYAFATQSLDQIKCEPVRQKLAAIVSARLSAGSAGEQTAHEKR